MSDIFYELGYALGQKSKQKKFEGMLGQLEQSKSESSQALKEKPQLEQALNLINNSDDYNQTGKEFYQGKLQQAQQKIDQPYSLLQKMAQVNPEATNRYLEIEQYKQQQLAQQQQAIQQQQQKQLLRGSQLAGTILETPEEARGLVYKTYLQKAQQEGLDVSEMPQEYNKDADFILRDLRNRGRDIENVVKQSQDIYKFNETQDLEKQKLAADNRQKLMSIQQNLSGKNFSNSMELRKEYTKNSSSFIDVRDAYNRLKTSFEQPSAAGDISAVYNFMKMLDPSSTVREGEYATAKNAAGIPTRILNQYNKALKGEFLSPEQRKDFEKQADNLYNAQLKSQEKIDTKFKEIAERNNLNVDDVIMDFKNEEKSKTINKTDYSKMSNDELLKGL